MPTAYILFNPKAGSGTCEEEIAALDAVLPIPAKVLDITKIRDYGPLLKGLEPGDRLILAGGDGTVNRFLNDTAHLPLPEKIWLYPIGTGNDLARELGYSRGDAPFPLPDSLRRLPTVEVEGQTCRFINGVGFGIDGYCTREGDRLRDLGKKVNYTAIAVKGLLFHYRPTSAVVTVDGQRHTYEKVWLAPTMLGKYYGGGMIPTPGQDRDRDALSVLVFHGSGKLRTLMIFPSIFKGTHTRYKSYVDVLRGREITVTFESPRPLQIDGETVPEARFYHAAVGEKTQSIVP